jgi:hypothetical protein
MKLKQFLCESRVLNKLPNSYDELCELMDKLGDLVKSASTYTDIDEIRFAFKNMEDAKRAIPILKQSFARYNMSEFEFHILKEYHGSPLSIVANPTSSAMKTYFRELISKETNRYDDDDFDTDVDSKIEMERCLRPASVQEYINWLDGYVKHGGKITHKYNYSFSNAQFETATKSFALASPGLYGSAARNIIVPRSIKAKMYDMGHCNLYFMDDFKLIGFWVPIYKEGVFDIFRKKGAVK